MTTSYFTVLFNHYLYLDGCLCHLAWGCLGVMAVRKLHAQQCRQALCHTKHLSELHERLCCSAAFDTADYEILLQHHLRQQWRCSQMVHVIPAWSVTICTNWDLVFISHQTHLPCPSRISPWPASVHFAHCQNNFVDKKLWSDTAFIRRWHTHLRFVPSC